MGNAIKNYQFPSGQVLEICQGDITRESTDAIVNAANPQLLHSGGVAAAIAHGGGKVISRESSEWISKNGPVSHTCPAITSGGNLTCSAVIHAVGPVWGEGDEDRKLKEAILGSLTTAEGLEITSLAFPAISTGIYGFPKDRAAGIFMHTIQDYFETHPRSLVKLVKIVLMDEITLDAFIEAFQKTFGNQKKA